MAANCSLGLSTATAALGTAKKSAAVLYHYPCPDGAFAALAAHVYFSAASLPALFFPNTVYAPLAPHQLPLRDIGDLYLLDFVGPSGFVREISPHVSRVVILDHHKTALEMLSGDGCNVGDNAVKILDMERSGATIAYDYFKEKLVGNSKVGEFERMRRLFEYIEDGDLWRWRLPNSKAFSSGLKDSNIEFDVRLNPSLFRQEKAMKALDRFLRYFQIDVCVLRKRLLSLDLEAVINQGMLSLSQKQKLIDDVLDQSYEISMGNGAFGHCLAVDADSISELRSELGNQLADKSYKMKLRGIGAVVYRVPELENYQLLKVSLRSLDSEDTTHISQNFGGGGHRNASSFMISSAEYEQWKVQQ